MGGPFSQMLLCNLPRDARVLGEWCFMTHLYFCLLALVHEMMEVTSSESERGFYQTLKLK